VHTFRPVPACSTPGSPGWRKALNIDASGFVGSFAVHLAKSLDAEVTGVTSTGRLDLARALGAHHLLDDTRTDFAHGRYLGGSRRPRPSSPSSPSSSRTATSRRDWTGPTRSPSRAAIRHLPDGQARSKIVVPFAHDNMHTPGSRNTS
jgi:hypothetical protein